MEATADIEKTPAINLRGEHKCYAKSKGNQAESALSGRQRMPGVLREPTTTANQLAHPTYSGYVKVTIPNQSPNQSND
jgi:hypothetical protein